MRLIPIKKSLKVRRLCVMISFIVEDGNGQSNQHGVTIEVPGKQESCLGGPG